MKSNILIKLFLLLCIFFVKSALAMEELKLWTDLSKELQALWIKVVNEGSNEERF